LSGSSPEKGKKVSPQNGVQDRKVHCDNDEIAAATGECAACGGRKPEPAMSQFDFSLAIFVRANPGPWKLQIANPKGRPK
jgi:hypothetical protein